MPTKTAVPFLKEVARLGLDFTGYARTEPYLTQDGSLQQIFDNLVMVLNPQYPDTVHLLPLAEKLGLMGDALQTPAIDTTLYFYPVQGGLGYNVPPYFIDYIQKHGGMELVGAPVSQLSQQDSQTYRQCFRNLCLEAQFAESGEISVTPVHLGLKYRDLFYRRIRQRWTRASRSISPSRYGKTFPWFRLIRNKSSAWWCMGITSP